MSQPPRTASFGPAAAPARDDLQAIANECGRELDQRKPIAGIKCSVNWRDIGARKRGLIKIRIAERNEFAESVVEVIRKRER